MQEVANMKGKEYSNQLMIALKMNISGDKKRNEVFSTAFQGFYIFKDKYQINHYFLLLFSSNQVFLSSQS